MTEHDDTMKSGERIHYYEHGEGERRILFIHAQGICGDTYWGCMKSMKGLHTYAVDCHGHGKSSHDRTRYRLDCIGDDLIEFIEQVIASPVIVVGHSSGGLIAGYIAAHCDKCCKLVLEDPPFFSSCGERRFKSFNYIDLSTVCHSFIAQSAETDFPLYYFKNQAAWQFFPEKDRDKLYGKLCANAEKYRQKHPYKNLKVMFWPKYALAAFAGMNNYDPYFGEAFYSDSFNSGIDYELLLSSIRCETLIMKANSKIGDDGILQGAMSDEDVAHVHRLIANSTITSYDCGHGIHMEKEKQFVRDIEEFAAKKVNMLAKGSDNKTQTESSRRSLWKHMKLHSLL